MQIKKRRLKMADQLKQESKDTISQKSESSELYDLPLILCRTQPKPSAMKRLVTSVLTCLGLLISSPFWAILLGLGIIAHYAKCLLTRLGIAQKLDRLYLNRVKRSWYK